MDPDTLWKLYEFEWEQRNQLASAVNVPILAITAIGSVAGTIASTFQYEFNRGLTITFASSLIVTSLLLVLSVFLVFRFLLTASYRKLASPVGLIHHFDALVAWHLANGSTRDAATNEFQGQLNLHLATATHANAINNEQRSEAVRTATIFLALAIVTLSAAIACYAIVERFAPASVYPVKIVS